MSKGDNYSVKETCKLCCGVFKALQWKTYRIEDVNHMLNKHLLNEEKKATKSSGC